MSSMSEQQALHEEDTLEMLYSHQHASKEDLHFYRVVLQLFGAVDDARRELLKDAVGLLFEVSTFFESSSGHD